MPELAGAALKPVPAQICDFVAHHSFDDYVCLGHGPFYGLACEYALKITEMSLSNARSFHSLEFRTAPIDRWPRIAGDFPAVGARLPGGM